MATISEMLVSIKVQLEQSTLGRVITNIQHQVDAIKDPTITPHVNTSPALAALQNIKQSYQNAQVNIKANLKKAAKENFNSGLSGVETAAIGAGIGYAVKQAVDLDDAMLGVKKQVGDVVDEAGKYTARGESIKNAIRDISKESGVAQSSVAGLFEEAGKSGIQSEEELKKYAMRIIHLKSAFDLTEESLPSFAKSISEYGAAMKLNSSETGVFVDKLNYLDDQVTNVEGGSLLDFSKRTASTTKNLGLSENAMLSWGATALNSGQQAEMAATAFNAMMPKLLTAKETFKKNDPFKVIGLTAADVQSGMVKNADQMLLTIMEKASKLDKVTKANFLGDIAGTEHQSKLGVILNNLDVYKDSMAKANSEAAKGSAQKEYQKRLASISGELDVLKSNMSDVAITAGESLLPAFNDLIKTVIPIIKSVGDWIKEHQELVKNILLGVGALVAFKGVGLALMFGIRALGSMFTVLQGALFGVQLALNIVKYAFLALRAVTPMGWLILGIGLVVSALLYMATHWDKVKAVAKAALDGIISAVKFVGDAIIGAFKFAIDGVIGMFTALFDKAKAVWNGIKSIFGGKIEANPNVQATLNATRAREGNYGMQLPQAVLTNHYNTVANKQNSASTTNNNQRITVNVAPNGSATQGKDVINTIQQYSRSQNKSSLAYAGSGYK